MSDSVSAPPVPPQRSMSALGRLVGVFFAPGETFEDIARRPDFIFPLVLMIIASAAVIETMLWKIGAEALVRNSLEMSGRAASMSADQMNEAVHRAAGITAIIMHVSALIGAPIFLLIITGISLLILNMILGVQVGLKPVFSATCYAALVRLTGVVMAIPLIFMGDPEHLNAQNPIPTNVGFFLDPRSTSQWLYSLASSLDLLSLWFLIVLAIGLSKLSEGKAKSQTIFFIFFGLWMLLALGRAGFAALF
jgi:Yip1 domain